MVLPMKQFPTLTTPHPNCRSTWFHLCFDNQQQSHPQSVQQPYCIRCYVQHRFVIEFKSIWRSFRGPNPDRTVHTSQLVCILFPRCLCHSKLSWSIVPALGTRRNQHASQRVKIIQFIEHLSCCCVLLEGCESHDTCISLHQIRSTVQISTHSTQPTRLKVERVQKLCGQITFEHFWNLMTHAYSHLVGVVF